MPLNWKLGALAEGLACYRRTEFFQAHEHWESVWLRLDEPEKSFLQSLIQMTAAFHHLQVGNTVGAVSLLRRALRRLEQHPQCFGGIAVTPLCSEICEWLERLESGNLPRHATFPQIIPVDPPPETHSRALDEINGAADRRFPEKV